MVSAENTCGTIRAIRAYRQYHQLQIVVLGTPADAADKTRFRMAGADGFITKPGNRDEIAALLNARLAPSFEQRQRQTA
jgi:DNA-binding response OmpR family regulator